MGTIKATNWAFRILLSWASVSDIVQLQDLHQTAFISSQNWDVGQAIKSRKSSFTKYCCDSPESDAAICGRVVQLKISEAAHWTAYEELDFI